MSGHHVPEAGVVAATHLSGEEAQSGIVGIDQLRAAGARGGAMSVIAQAAKALLGFGGTIVLARLLTPADFGLVAMVVAVTGFLSLFREMGLSTATVQAKTITDAQVSSLFWLNTLVGILLTLLIVAVAQPIAWFYDRPQLASIALVLAPGALLSAASSQHRALLRRRMRFTALAVIDVASYALALAVGIIMAARGAGYYALAVMPVLTDAGLAIGAWTACRWTPRRHVAIDEVRPLLATGRDLVGFDVVNYWARNLDNLLIGRFWGAAALGGYSRAYQIMMLPITLVSTPIGMVATSALSRIDDPAMYRATANSLVQKIALFTLPFAVVMIGAADWVVAVLLGSQWAAAAPILRVLGVAAVTQPVGHTAGWLLITQGRSRELLRWGLIGGATAMVSIAAGLPWGAFGVALSYVAVGLLVRTPLLFWYIGRRGPVRARDLARTLVIPLCAAAAALTAVLGFRRLATDVAPLPGLLASGAITAVMGIGVMLLLPGGRHLLRNSMSLVRLAIVPGRTAA